MRKGLIVTGGKLDMAFARSFLEAHHFDKIIAVDAGLAIVDALGVVPDYVVGDFDTADAGLMEKYKKMPHIVWEVHKPEKDETDTELARSCAVALGCEEIAFLGATGGRLDHLIGNIHALYDCMQRGIAAYIVDSQNKLYLLDEGKTFCRNRQWGKYVSFLPYTEEVRGITLSGFRYPLTERNIRRGEEVGLCISNEIAEDRAEIRFEEGILICVESHD